MNKKREHINLLVARSGDLFEGYALTVARVNGLPDGEALVGQDFAAALDALRADGWQLSGTPPHKHGSKKEERVFLYRDVEQKRTLPPIPTPEDLDARRAQRQADALAARKAIRALRERFADREPTPEELAALSPEDRARLAALRLTQRRGGR